MRLGRPAPVMPIAYSIFFADISRLLAHNTKIKHRPTLHPKRKNIQVIDGMPIIADIILKYVFLSIAYTSCAHMDKSYVFSSVIVPW